MTSHSRLYAAGAQLSTSEGLGELLSSVTLSRQESSQEGNGEVGTSIVLDLAQDRGDAVLVGPGYLSACTREITASAGGHDTHVVFLEHAAAYTSS